MYEKLKKTLIIINFDLGNRYMKIVMKGLLWSLYNAYVIEGHFVDHCPPGKTKTDFRTFCLDVCHQLISHFSARSNTGRPRSIETVTDPPVRLTKGDHFPMKSDSYDLLCAVCYKKYAQHLAAYPNMKYKDRPLKKVKTHFMCQLCATPLCIACWGSWHQKVEYWR